MNGIEIEALLPTKSDENQIYAIFVLLVRLIGLWTRKQFYSIRIDLLFVQSALKVFQILVTWSCEADIVE